MRAPFTRVAVAGLAAVALFAAACTGGEDGPTAPVFEGPPWDGAETYEYQLSRRGEDDYGRCTLITEPEFEPGLTRLSRLCANEPHRDDGVAVVDSATLRPVRSERTLVDGEEGRQATWQIIYEEGQARFAGLDEEDRYETTRELPGPTEEAPNPAWYDDESLLWLVRGLPLRPGFEGSFAHVINVGQPRVLVVDVEVGSTERIEVGGAEVEAWPVRIARGGTVYRYWVETEAPHRLLRAVIEEVTYELIDGPRVAR